MINIRKTKYIVITDGVENTTEANIVACDDIYEAQDVFRKAIDDCLDPVIMETAQYIRDSVLDRYAGFTTSKDLYKKIKEGQVPKPKKATKEMLREIINRKV